MHPDDEVIEPTGHPEFRRVSVYARTSDGKSRQHIGSFPITATGMADDWLAEVMLAYMGSSPVLVKDLPLTISIRIT